jgi:hypothetical protein
LLRRRAHSELVGPELVPGLLDLLDRFGGLPKVTPRSPSPPHPATGA